MKSARVPTFLGVIVATVVLAQSPPQFEISDVHASGRAANPYTFVSGGSLRAGRYDLRKATLLDLIRIAYGIDADKVLGAPSWLELNRYDVSAKAPPNTSPEALKLMLQALLADRFQLVLHNETRPMPAFVLLAGKGKPKLKDAAASADSGCKNVPQPNASPVTARSCRGITMEGLAQALRGMAGDYLPYPVTDSTNLTGAWDFELQWNPRSQVLAANAPRTTIFNAVDQQLGLTLTLTNLPAPVVVVDRANANPSANPPGVAEALPPRPVEFEAASLRPSAPGEAGDFRLTNGRFEARAYPMKVLLGMAFDVDWDHVNDVIQGVPKWVDSRNFDITAKMPPASAGPAGFGFLPDDDTRLMLRALLIDRFQMKVHYEDRAVSAQSLVAVKPKMKKADPSRRSRCKDAGVVPDDPRDRNPRLSELIVCENVTMAQFAMQLQPISPYDFPFPVEDSTGLPGAYDFSFNYTPSWMMNSGAVTQPANGPAAASEPNGAISLFEAVAKQLGLKIEQRKRTLPVLVIDRMEEKPLDN